MKLNYITTLSILIVIMLLDSCSKEKIQIDSKPIIVPISNPHSINNYILSLENLIVEKNSTGIRLSKDGGQTWNEWLRIDITVGFIRYIHVFADYSLMICNDTKVFYSTDWVKLTESTVYDVDGSRFVPGVNLHNFSAYEMDNVRQIVDGTEIICWGSYDIESNGNYVPRTWYTADKGHTVKCCFKFGTSIPVNSEKTINIRHVHCVNFNKNDKTFWLQTGDFDSQNNWLQGTYNIALDSWKWTLIGCGYEFKTNMLCFVNGYIYAAWDITPGGVFRVIYENAGDLSKREQLFTTPNDCLSIAVGPREDILAIITTWGGNENPRYLYYSPDKGVTWNTIKGDLPAEYEYNGCLSTYYFTWGLNSNNKILSGVHNQKEVLSAWSLTPSIWLDEVIRNSGFPNAFMP